MRKLVVLLFLVHSHAFAGGGGGGSFETVGTQTLLKCTGKSIAGHSTSVEIRREERVYDEIDSGITYVLVAKSNGQRIEIETPSIEDVITNGDPEKGSVVRSKVSYLKPSGKDMVSLSGAELEADLRPGQGGTLKIWEYTYSYEGGKKGRGALLLSLKVEDCLLD